MIILVVLVAVTMSGCSKNGHPGASGAARVLGEPSGTPLVVGQPAPNETTDLGAVSCANAKRCWAVGTAGPDTTPAPGGAAVIARTVDGGASWKAQHVSGGSTPDLSGISCPNSTDCMAVGSNGSSLPGGGVVVVTGDAGALWKLTTAPTGALTIASVFCSVPANCIAIVSDGTLLWSALTMNFGETWQQLGDLPSAFLADGDLSCTAAGTCLVAGYVRTASGQGQGAVSVSTDGGHTWALGTVPAGTGILQTVTCPSASVCLAAGTESTIVSDIVPAQGELLQSADGGHTWTDVTPAPPVDDIYAMECASAQVCAMVGTKWVGKPAIATGAVAQSGDGGASFKASSNAYIPITLTALSCPTRVACVAVGGDTVARLTLVPPGPPARHSHR